MSIDKCCLILFLLGFNMGFSFGQNFDEEREVKPLTKSEIENIKEEMGKDKKVLPEFEKAIYHTLSYFPELKNTNIRFKYQKISTSLNARPTVLSLLLRNKEKRRYIIRINNCVNDSTVDLSKVSYNAQIGVLAHEFSHFIDYSEKGLWGIFKRLMSYTSKKSKAKFEKEIDKLTIERGLGKQLYDWAYTVLYDSNACYKYKKLKMEVYLSPVKILSYHSSLE